MRPNELPFVVLRSRLISKKSLSGRIMRLVLLFMLQTQNDPIISELGVFVWPLLMLLCFSLVICLTSCCIRL